MNSRSKWMIPMGVMLAMMLAISLILVPGIMADSGKATVLVNINNADIGELTSLPGIGTSKATAIIEHRSEHGPFNTIEELTNVRGIGSNVLEKIRGHIKVQ